MWKASFGGQEKFFFLELIDNSKDLRTFVSHSEISESSSAGRAQPCQG
jgi:hypothetical protein